MKLAIEKKLSKDSSKQSDNASIVPTNDDITSTVPSENYIPSFSNTSQSGSKNGETKTAEKPPRDLRDSQEAKIPKVNIFQ